MRLYELHALLGEMIEKGHQLAEVRIGDMIESGPYLNTSVASVFQDNAGHVIICGSDDEDWRDETIHGHEAERGMPILWPASARAEWERKQRDSADAADL